MQTAQMQPEVIVKNQKTVLHEIYVSAALIILIHSISLSIFCHHLLS